MFTIRPCDPLNVNLGNLGLPIISQNNNSLFSSTDNRLNQTHEIYEIWTDYNQQRQPNNLGFARNMDSNVYKCFYTPSRGNSPYVYYVMTFP